MNLWGGGEQGRKHEHEQICLYKKNVNKTGVPIGDNDSFQQTDIIPKTTF